MYTVTGCSFFHTLANRYFHNFCFSNKNTWTRCEIYQKSAVKILEQIPRVYICLNSYITCLDVALISSHIFTSSCCPCKCLMNHYFFLVTGMQLFRIFKNRCSPPIRGEETGILPRLLEYDFYDIRDAQRPSPISSAWKINSWHNCSDYHVILRHENNIWDFIYFLIY